MNAMIFKLSSFNNLFDFQQNRYLWNAESGALLRLDDDGFSFYNRLRQSGDSYSESSFSMPELKYFTILRKNGFLVSSQTNEVSLVLSRFDDAVNSKSPEKLQFTIAPGLGCNFNCVYCFESGRRHGEGMSPMVVEETIQYINETLEKYSGVKRIVVSWFGGEPLLFLNQVVHISEALISSCLKKKVLYSAGMVSNGRFLTPDKFNVLKAAHIKTIQISIDGTQSIYCQKKGAQPTDFATVIDNIKEAASMFQIVVRINPDQSNYSDAYKLTDYLLKDCKLDGRIKIYLAYVREAGLSQQEYDQKQDMFNKEIIRYSTYLLKNYSSKSFAVPVPRQGMETPCQSIRKHNICIGPLGELYRCEHDFGNEIAQSGSIHMGHQQSEWENRFYDKLPEKCIKCSILPVCFGGCRHGLVHSCEHMNCSSLISRMCAAKVIEFNLSNLQKKEGKEVITDGDSH